MSERACRVCGVPMQHTLVDLGMVPLCQSYTGVQDLDRGEMFYPLYAQVCMRCLYVGVPEYLAPEDIFTEYAYFSSMSDSWLEYAARSAESMIEVFKLDSRSQVIEMASNDGYLLQFFVKRGVPALGVEPAANVAKVANEKGVPTLARFFTAATASELKAAGKAADLLLAYNCLDHVPDPNDVVSGMKLLLKPHGVVHVEFPYLRSMIDGNQFDTVYHDRYSYFCFHSVRELFSRNGLRVFDVQRISTHGGSLRVRACHEEDTGRLESPAVAQLIEEERQCGMGSPQYYRDYMNKVVSTKHRLLDFLLKVKQEGRSVVGYGVPAKGNVLLNYCGIRGDLVEYLVDRSAYKVGKYAPGTRLPIYDVERIRQTSPDYVMILPWNIKDEIMEQMSYIREWGGRFVVAIPNVQVL